MKRLVRLVMAATAACAVFACTPTPDPSGPPPAFGFSVECGPIQDVSLCRKAIEVASTAKLNPPPITAASIRRPRDGDECVTARFHVCGPEAVIVVIQSGDTLQDVALVRTADSWARLDIRR